VTGAALLLVCLGALASAGWLVATACGIPGLVGRMLGTFTAGFGWLVVLSLALSAPGWLARWPLCLGIGLGLVLAALAWHRAGRPPLSPPGTRDALRCLVGDPIVGVLLGAVALELAYALVFSVVIPQSDWDALVYHLPRAAEWAQQGGIGWIAGAVDPRLNGFPVHAELVVADTMLLAGSDRYVGLVQLLSLVATVVAVHGIGRRLGLGLRQAAFGALVFATFTVVALQATSALNDLVLAAPLAAAVYLALGSTTGELALSGVAVGLAFGVKLTAALAAPLALLVVLLGTARPRRVPVVAAWAGGAIAGSYWYVVARVHTGSFDGGVAAFQNQTPDRSVVPTLARAASFLLAFFDAPGVARADRWLFPLAGAVLAAAALVAARRHRPARGLVVAAVLVAGAPLAVYALHRILSRGFSDTVDALGRPAEAARLDRGISSLADTMGSWYGLAFLLLAIATPVLVIRAIRTGAVARAAVPAAFAPLLFVPLLAVAVVDDELRGRFFVLPVALASATFGVALSHRWLAWSAATLAVLTALLSFVHFDDRPAGIRLLAARTQPSLWRAPRWEALGAHHRRGRDDPRAFRALEERVPADAVLAYAVGADEYVYPAFDGRLRRRVVLVPLDGRVPSEATWTMVGPGGSAQGCAGAWERIARPAPRWRLSRRIAADGACPVTVPL
jgi:Glycosyltransferase family 87